MSAPGVEKPCYGESRIALPAGSNTTTTPSSSGTCRRGHQRTPENTYARRDGGVRCATCDRLTNIEAVTRYQATAAGMLSRVRSRAKERSA